MMPIDVSCYAGYRGEELPRRLTIGQRPIAVVAVTDRWLAPDHRYFKVLGSDGAIYIIRHDTVLDDWQLVSYKASVDVDRWAIAGPDTPTSSKPC
jgi:hypothetical protein